MEAIILAGGLGTRLREAVPDLPKPMAPVHNHPFLEYQLDYWTQQGVRQFILSVGYRAEKIVSHFGDKFGTAKIAYAIERRPLGTGGGIRMAAGLLRESGPCLVLNGDTYFDVDLKKLWAFHKSRRAELTLSLLNSTDDGRYGRVELDAMGRIRRFDAAESTSPKTAAKKLINGGVYLAESALLKSFEKPTQALSFERDVLGKFLGEERRLFGFENNGVFVDIGIPEDYQKASSLLDPSLLNVRRLKNAS